MKKETKHKIINALTTLSFALFYLTLIQNKIINIPCVNIVLTLGIITYIIITLLFLASTIFSKSKLNNTLTQNPENLILTLIIITIVITFLTIVL